MTDNLKPTFTTIYSSSNDEKRVTSYELELEPFKNDETTATTTTIRDYAQKNGSSRMRYRYSIIFNLIFYMLIKINFKIRKYIGDRKGWFICLGLMMSVLIAVLMKSSLPV